MFKRDRHPKPKKSKLRKLRAKLQKTRKVANTTSSSVHPTARRGESLVIKVTGIRKEQGPDEYDKKALVHALLELGVEKCIKQVEEELATFKGNRSKHATAQRKALRAEIENFRCYRNRLRGLPDNWRDPLTQNDQLSILPFDANA